MLIIDTMTCDSCGTCITVCPYTALVLTDILAVDSQRCISCGLCVSICPYGALALSGAQNEGTVA